MEREFGKEFRLPGERTCSVSLVQDWTEVGFEVSVARRFAWMLNVRIAFWSLCVMVFKETKLEWHDFKSLVTTFKSMVTTWEAKLDGGARVDRESDPQPARFYDVD